MVSVSLEGRSLRNHLQHAVLRLDHALGLQPPGDVGDRADVAIEAAVAVAFRTGEGKRPPYGPVGAKEPELAGVDLLTGGSQAPFLPHARDVLRMDHSEPALLDRLLRGKPRHLREMRVDVRRRSGETRLEDADGSDVGERVIPALAVAQRLIGAAAFRDVVRHTQQAGDLPLRIAQRHCLRLEPAPRALQADHLELESAAVALHDLSMQNAEGRAIRRRDELDERLTLGLFERLGLEHRQARGVHLEQPAILRDDLHARRLGLQETLAVLALTDAHGPPAVCTGSVEHHQAAVRRQSEGGGAILRRAVLHPDRRSGRRQREPALRVFAGTDERVHVQPIGRSRHWINPGARTCWSVGRGSPPSLKLRRTDRRSRNRTLNQKLVIRANRMVRGNPGEMFVLPSAFTK